MDLKSTINIILKDLKEARDIMDDLKNYPGVPEIQIELAKAKCRSAEEVIKFLTEETRQDTRRKTQGGESEELSETKEKEQLIDNKEIAGEKTESKEDKEEEIEERRNELISEIDSKDNIDVFDLEDFEESIEEKIVTESIKEEEIINQIIQPETNEGQVESSDFDAGSGKILADKFSKESSINEQIASQRHDKESEDVSKIKPLGELSDAIGINDRFQFVRELFNGDQELYKQTISNLNKASDIDDAFDILTKASKAEKDNQTFDQLLELVKRKLRTS